MKSAKEILGFDFNADAFARRAPQPSKPSQKNLNILKDIVEKHGNADYEPPKREDLRQIYDLFIRASSNGSLHQEFNTSKRIRQLTWVLTFSEEKQTRIVDNRSQLRHALQLIRGQFRISNLAGIFDALLQTWNTPNTGMLRDFVKKNLTDYNGKRKFAQKLKTNMKWYCEENSATQLAMELLRSNRKLSEVWSFLDLPDYMHTYSYFGAVSEAFVSLVSHLDREILEDVVEYLGKHNNDTTSRSILSKLIEKLGVDASEHVRDPVQSYVLRKLEDPRITGADVKWHGVSPEARKIFTKWLTEADLKFFFDIVAKACDDDKFAYRKAFWMAYLERIDFCRPVLHKDIKGLIRTNPDAVEFYNARRPPALTGGGSKMHAFIIQMKDYTFVEFSTAGACYVYDNLNLPFELDDSVYTMSKLKNQLRAKRRVIHFHSEKYSWQAKFKSWIYSKLDIEPERSYRL